MIVRPRMADFKIIGLYTGKVIIGVGLLMVIPLATSLLFREWNPAIDFLLGIGACLVFGFGLEVLCPTSRDLAWGHGPEHTGGRLVQVDGIRNCANGAVYHGQIDR